MGATVLVCVCVFVWQVKTSEESSTSKKLQIHEIHFFVSSRSGPQNFGGSPTLATNFSDEQLCMIARGGSQLPGITPALSADEAFEELYTRQFPRISRLASMMLSRLPGCGLDGEFVANGVMFRIFQAIRKEQYDEKRPFQPWANQITRFAVRDLARKKTTFSTLESIPETIVESSEDPLLGVIATEEAKAARLALDALPEDERSVIELHYLKGLSVHQIELQLGKSNGAVRGLIQRAKERLRVSS